MGRAPCCDKANVKKGPWSPEEDAKLKAYIEQHGTGGNWIALPQKIGLKRCGKSCRLRWLNYLRPNIKHGGFTDEEDNIICSLYISIGSRWSIIAAQLPGRTDNDIKNYWNTRLKKKLLGRRKHNRISIPGPDSNDHAPNIGVDNGNSYDLQNLSSSALERLQLHMQLQNPLSYYNNPALWPKMLNPLMIQNLLNQSNIPIYQNTFDPQPGSSHVLDHHQQKDYSSSTLKAGIDDSIVSGSFSSPESSFSALNSGDQNTVQESGFIEQKNTMNHHTSSGFTQSDIDDLLRNNNKSPSVLFPVEGELEFFNGSKDNLAWWGELEAAVSTSSSNSWLHQSDQQVQDYTVMGYGVY